MLMLLLLQVGVVMKKDNSREIMDAVNTEYEAGVKVHQGRKLNRYEKPETREVMLKTNPEGKYDEGNVVRKRGNVRQEQVEQLLKVLGYKLIGDEQNLLCGAREDRFNGDTGRHDDDYDVINVEKLSRQSVRTPMGEPVIKSFGNAALKNILVKDPGKDKVHEKPETRAVMVDITDAFMLNTEYKAEIKVHQGRELNMYEKPETRDVMLTTKGKYDENVNNVMDENNAAAPIEDLQLKKQLYEKPEKRDMMDDIIDAVMLNTEYEAGVKVHRGRELNMYEKPEMRDGMLKTNPKGKYDENVNNVMDKNNVAAPIEDLKLYNGNYYQYSTSEGRF
jgi:hypothetical protein